MVTIVRVYFFIYSLLLAAVFSNAFIKGKSFDVVDNVKEDNILQSSGDIDEDSYSGGSGLETTHQSSWFLSSFTRWWNSISNHGKEKEMSQAESTTRTYTDLNRGPYITEYGSANMFDLEPKMEGSSSEDDQSEDEIGAAYDSGYDNQIVSLTRNDDADFDLDVSNPVPATVETYSEGLILEVVNKEISVIFSGGYSGDTFSGSGDSFFEESGDSLHLCNEVNPCLNGGTCELVNIYAIRCLCTHEYTGDICAYPINPYPGDSIFKDIERKRRSPSYKRSAGMPSTTYSFTPGFYKVLGITSLTTLIVLVFYTAYNRHPLLKEPV